MSKLNDFYGLYEGEGTFRQYKTPEYVALYRYFLIPYVDKNKQPKAKAYGSLDVQDSKYHKENLTEHIAMVTARMADTTDELGIVIAMAHDLGKKYTIAISDAGDICFYGHEEISAEIAKEILKDKLSEEDLKVVYGVISTHSSLKLLKGETLACFVDGFKSLYGEKAYAYLVALDKADAGVTDRRDIDIEEVRKGNSIIAEMVEKYF